MMFHSYRSRLSPPSTDHCLLAAVNEAIQHVDAPDKGKEVIEDGQEYTHRDIKPASYPWREDFTWAQWAHAIGPYISL